MVFGRLFPSVPGGVRGFGVESAAAAAAAATEAALVVTIEMVAVAV